MPKILHVEIFDTLPTFPLEKGWHVFAGNCRGGDSLECRTCECGRPLDNGPATHYVLVCLGPACDECGAGGAVQIHTGAHLCDEHRKEFYR